MKEIELNQNRTKLNWIKLDRT